MINFLERLNQSEIPLCMLFNKFNHKRLFNRFFAVISRLGNGVFWYVLIALLPIIYGVEGAKVSLHMMIVAIVLLLIYRRLKSATLRVRPYRFDDNILQNVAVLDQFSFPSGHTMHAVGFSTVLLQYFPEWYWLVVPFTVLVGLSRLILGLHYPSDVLAGIALGSSIAMASFMLL
ncbi:phosphatase PAP2 family protein [Cocleimonas flava]|uniref:undecaprenyl-diphosphate phosphatase n=1 Tax=Cocleimonas flava TaxID=634765 RepID=A0A4R1EXE5_9GAMM|nr:phosphatase PAP2 family protein [Cocleimonas flava]TCJ84664.1 undecaprenyl-diphosphatase [Cocleimonas flava]